MTYLGTGLAPQDYYRAHADEYYNPHEAAVSELIWQYKHYLRGKILDLGCGNGLASRLLGPRCHGSDREPLMIDRYERETGNRATVCEFWDEQPVCNSVVAVYSLHLCPESRLHEVWYRLYETGASSVLIITPLKSKPGLPEHYFKLFDYSTTRDLVKGKTIHAMLLERIR